MDFDKIAEVLVDYIEIVDCLRYPVSHISLHKWLELGVLWELEGSVLSFYDEEYDKQIKHELNHLYFKKIACGCFNLGYINLYARFNDFKIKSIIIDLIDYTMKFMLNKKLEPKNYPLKLNHNDYPQLNYIKTKNNFKYEISI